MSEASRDDRTDYLQQAPTRTELIEVLLTVSSTATAVLNLAVTLCDNGAPKSVLDAVSPLVEKHKRLQGLMREMTNAGVDPDWDRRK